MPSLKYLPLLEPLFPKVQYGAADTTLMDRCNQNLWHLGRSWRMHFTIYLPLENSYSVENVQFHTQLQIVYKLQQKFTKYLIMEILTVYWNQSLPLEAWYTGNSLMKKKWTSIFFSVNFFDIYMWRQNPLVIRRWSDFTK